MQVATRRTAIQHLALCLDPTPASLAAEVALGADMVLSHHPLALKARLPARLDSYHAALSLLLQHDVALYAAHTSLDANPAGPVSWLADVLKLQDRVLLEPTSTGYGFGCCGTCPPCSLDGLVSTLKQHVNISTAACAAQPPHSAQVLHWLGGFAYSRCHCGSGRYLLQVM